MESTTPSPPSTGYTNIDNLSNGKLLQVSYRRLRKMKMPPKKKK